MLSALVCLSLLATALTKTACPSGWKELFGRAGYCVNFYKTQSNYFQALKTCNEKGGDLVTIAGGFTNNFFFTQAQSTFPSCSYWLGLNKMEGDDWAWQDGDPSPYRNWKNPTGPLSDDQGGSACASMNVELDRGKWNNVGSCGDKNCFACEIHMVQTTTTEVPTTTTTVETTTTSPPTTTTISTTTTTPEVDLCSLKIPDGVGIQGRPVTTCAFVPMIKSAKYLSLETECEERNGTLISIHSQAENDQIYNRFLVDDKGKPMSEVRHWIGLNHLGLNEADVSTWTWTNLSPVDYTNFVGGEIPPIRLSKIHSLRKNVHRKDMWQGSCVFMSGEIADGKWSNSANGETDMNMGICEVRLQDYIPSGKMSNL